MQDMWHSGRLLVEFDLGGHARPQVEFNTMKLEDLYYDPYIGYSLILLQVSAGLVIAYMLWVHQKYLRDAFRRKQLCRVMLGIESLSHFALFILFISARSINIIIAIEGADIVSKINASTSFIDLYFMSKLRRYGILIDALILVPVLSLVFKSLSRFRRFAVLLDVIGKALVRTRHFCIRQHFLRRRNNLQ